MLKLRTRTTDPFTVGRLKGWLADSEFGCGGWIGSAPWIGLI